MGVKKAMSRGVPSVFSLISALGLLSAVSDGFAADSALRGDSGHPPLPSCGQIVARMMEADQKVTPLLRDYTSIRRYYLQNERFNKSAEMTVRASFRYPGEKEFQIVSEQGSLIVRRKVLRRILESELEASRGELRQATQITPDNYSFRLLGTDVVAGRESYVLEAVPKGKNSYLFSGKIWVDAEDYAIARIEGSPAKPPSFLIRKSTFVHQYGRFGPFWLATANDSDTDARVFGRTILRIQYGDYRINQHDGGTGGAAAR